MRALDRKLWRDLWHWRGQVLAIAAVIMGGVATLVMSLSTYDSLLSTRDHFYREYRFADVFARLTRAPEPFADRLRAIEGVRSLETRVIAPAKIEIEGFSDPITGLVLSVPDSGPPLLNAVYLQRGRWIEPGREDEVVLSDTLANAHGLNPGDPIDLILNGRRMRVRIVGVGLSPEYVYQIAPGAMFPDFQRYGVVWMARRPLAAAQDMRGAFNALAIQLDAGTPVQTVIDRLDAMLALYGGRGAHARADQFSHRFVSEELKQLRTTATVFPAIFFGVAAFLLHVVVHRMVTLQREQIALLKAFGYEGRAIGGHFLRFVLSIALLGVLGGVALGVVFGQAMASVYMGFYRFPRLEYVLAPSVLLIALAVSLLAALSGAWTAVWRAMRLHPAEGMRAEAPKLYRTTLIERLGLQRHLAQPTRMILRHLEQRPFKSFLSMLGIAAACGLMMVGNYQRGAIEFMVDLQFRQAAREDLKLTFLQLTAGAALHELRALPGVYHVEGLREIPVILRHGPARYRHALYGIEPDGELHRALDREGRPVVVPEGGVVLTDHLAKRVLGIQPGDMLTVEVLEGRRPVLEVPVVGLTSQYLGVSAYMTRASLNALLQEGDVVSGAFLAHDRAREAELYAALRERPRVLGMVANQTAIRSFYATLGEFVLFFNVVATLLAASIAFGVVYNAARIALSERGRELASLRVLGFRRGEVAYILIGELILLTLAALPLGFLIGTGLCGILVLAFASDLYRLPLIIEPYNYALGASVVLASAFLSAWMAWQRLGRLDLVSALKTRE